MNRLKGYQRFGAFMADYGQHVVDPIAKKQRSPEDMSDQEIKAFDTIFRRFSEIIEAIDNIDLCLEFVKARTPRRKGVKLDRYLTYHITFYLQEIYILSVRMESYATLVKRMKKRADPSSVNEADYDQLIASLRSSFGGIVRTRGAHVHSRPFSDKSLEMLSMYSLLAVAVGKYVEEARDEYAEARQYWVRTLRDNRKAIDEVLDSYCDFMYAQMTAGDVEVLPGFSRAWEAKRQASAEAPTK